MSTPVESSGVEVDSELDGGSVDMVVVVGVVESVGVDVGADELVVDSVAVGTGGIVLSAPSGPSDVHADGSKHAAATSDTRAKPLVMRAR
jgi:hypothetical protein